MRKLKESYIKNHFASADKFSLSQICFKKSEFKTVSIENMLRVKNKGDSVFIIALGWMLAGWVVRVIYLITYQAPVRDAFKYKKQIEMWSLTGSIPDMKYFPPLPSFFFKTINNIFQGEIIRESTIANLFFGLIIILLTVLIAAQYTSDIRILFLIGGMAATHPSFVHYSCQMLRENLFLLTILLSFSLLIHYLKKRNIIFLILSSVFLGAGFLCRSESMEVLVIYIIILLCEKKKLLIKIKTLAIMTVVFALSALVLSVQMGIPMDYYLGTYKRILDKVYLLK